ncbi:MAG: hypothetical protein R3F20_06515 [Planctomycetota bacterium]
MKAGLIRGVYSKTVDDVVGVFPLGPVVEGESLQADLADDVRVSDDDLGEAVLTEEFEVSRTPHGERRPVMSAGR